MKEFIAHLHPLLVHLPIGILLLTSVFAWMARQEKHRALAGAVPVVLWLGAVSAVFACISGWLLQDGGGYDASIVQWHQWLGIGTAVAALAACLAPKKLALITFSTALLLLTGHYGGTLTHGEGYLTQSLDGDAQAHKRPADVQEALAYSDIIAPILREKCISCHGSTKQKGGLRLDQPDQILKGGKGGAVVKPGDAANSELLRRCLLSENHEDHMPPKEKPQLSMAELEILRWWLSQGADFQQKTSALPQNESVRKALAAWQGGAVVKQAESEIPEKNAQPAPALVVEKLRNAGVLLLSVSRESNWLSISFVNLPQPPGSVFVLLEKLAPQVLWLNLEYCNVPPTAWPLLGKLTQLRRLSLAHTTVTDADLTHLKALPSLKCLNLVETSVTGSGLQVLAEMPGLEQLFLYKTNVSTAEREAFRQQHSQLLLDTGGYDLPFLDSDTARLKAPKAY